MHNCLEIIDPDLQMFLICKLLRNIYKAVNKLSTIANSKKFRDLETYVSCMKPPYLLKVTNFLQDQGANMNFIVISVKIKSMLPHCNVPLFICCWKNDQKMTGLYLAEMTKFY